MNYLSPFIKLNKNTILKDNQLQDKEALLISYLFFHTTCEKKIYTTLNQICKDLHFSTNSHNQERNGITIVRQYLQHFVDLKIITISNVVANSFDEIKKDSLLEIYYNDYENYISPESDFIIITLEEFNEIVGSGKNAYKLFNVFCEIKKYICLDNNCLKICYPSISGICKHLNCRKPILLSFLNLLEKIKVMFVYDFKGILYRGKQLDNIFSLEQYGEKKIKEYLEIKS